MATDAREAAWFAVHDALPAYWLVGPVTFDPGRRKFSVTARSPNPGRDKVPVSVSGAGETEIAALVDLRGEARAAQPAAAPGVLLGRHRSARLQ